MFWSLSTREWYDCFNYPSQEQNTGFFQVDFSFNNGDNEVTIQLDTTTLGVSLCDGKWHSLTLTKDTLIGTITLDSVFEATGSAPNGLSGTDTFAPLYFGGVPSLSTISSIPRH